MGEAELTRILVVEDDKIAQKIARIVLNFLECEADVVGNGATALKLFSENRYDLVFIDLGLPDLSGYSVAKELRNIEKSRCFTSVPVIGLSVHTGEKYHSLALEAGMSDYVTKPLTSEKCLKLFKELKLSNFHSKELVSED